MEIGSLNNIALYALKGAETKTGEVLGLAMLSNQLEATEVMSDSMIRAMELSVNPAVGGNIDVSV